MADDFCIHRSLGCQSPIQLRAVIPVHTKPTRSPVRADRAPPRPGGGTAAPDGGTAAPDGRPPRPKPPIRRPGGGLHCPNGHRNAVSSRQAPATRCPPVRPALAVPGRNGRRSCHRPVGPLRPGPSLSETRPAAAAAVPPAAPQARPGPAGAWRGAGAGSR